MQYLKKNMINQVQIRRKNMTSQVQAKVKKNKLRTTNTKGHLDYTKVCGFKLNLKKLKSYHTILTTNVSTLFRLIQYIVLGLRKMAGHGTLGLHLPESILVECEEKHAVVVVLNAWNEIIHLVDIIRKKTVCNLIHQTRHVASVENLDFMFLVMLSKSGNSTTMKIWLRFSIMVSITV